MDKFEKQKWLETLVKNESLNLLKIVMNKDKCCNIFPETFSEETIRGKD